jgi:hypothetical protein
MGKGHPDTGIREQEPGLSVKQWETGKKIF